MDKAAIIRKAFLFAALAATVYASLRSEAGAPEHGKSRAPAVIHPPMLSAPAAAQPAEELGAESDGSDPFEQRNWTPPPPEPVKEVIAPMTVAPPVVQEGPPPLPFQFMGRMSDGGDQVVYLGRGEQALIARVGEVLESNYKVVAINAAQIEFEYLPTKQRQILSMQSN